MEIDKLRKWMEAAQHFQSETFWNSIFDSSQKSASSLNGNPFTSVTDFFPKCDLFETDQYLMAEVELPGMTKENMKLSIQEQMLTISGEFNSFTHGRKYFLKERANRSFKKEIPLPFPILLEKVRTEFRNGILYIAMPINQEEMETIPINFEPNRPDQEVDQR